MKSVAFMLGLFGWGMLLGHCKPKPAEHPTYCYTEKAFTDELKACVAKHAERPEMRACRAEVHERCGIKLTSSAGDVLP